jgi:hypothetical protein
VDDGAEADLHNSLFGVRGPDEALWRALASHRATLDLLGVEVPALDTAGSAFVVALHAAQHGADVPHAVEDLERALARLDESDWRDALQIADEAGASAAFREGLSGLEHGRAMLEKLGAAPAVTVRSAVRQHGVRVPVYLSEDLTSRERFALMRGRVLPARAELASTVDPRAATSTTWLLVAHSRRLARLPVRYLRLAAAVAAARRGRNRRRLD